VSDEHVRTNAAQVAARLRARAARAPLQAAATVQQYTVLLQTRVKAAASGRPGPRVITGNYRRSITSHVRLTPTLLTGTVGTNAPQGMRLENGFYGTDALGRMFRQPPLPHFGPSARITRPEFRDALRAVGTLGQMR